MNKKLNLEFIKSSVDDLVNFVKPTYGPAGNKVILTDGKVGAVLDDGVSIAELYKSDNKFEQAIHSLVVEVARRTNKRVGDGTTGSLIMAQALVDGLKEDTNVEELKKAKDEAIFQLKVRTVDIQKREDLEKVAYMAYRDSKHAKIVSEIIHKLGPEAVVSLEESPNLETVYEFAEGIQFERGFLSPYMVTDTQKMEAVWEDAPILLTDKKIQSINELVPLCEVLVKSNFNRLVVIADDFLGDTLSTVVTNILQKKFGMLCIKAPGFAHRKRELLEDMAIVTGGQVVGLETESSNGFTDAILGRAKKVVAGREKTIIVNGAGDQETIDARVESLKQEGEKQATDFDKARVQERIARLTTGVAIIKVGAPTESEMKAVKYKIEDALNAAKAALKGGVVLGGGQALRDIKTSSELLNEALKAPRKVLEENGGKLEEVYDPVDVLVASIESAVSVAVLLKESKGIIVTQ